MNSRRICNNLTPVFFRLLSICLMTLCLNLTLFSPASAGQESVLKEMTYLVERQQFGKAYKLGLSNPQLRGQTRFDFLFGLSAVKNGNIPEGLMALERHLNVVPANDRARLELALAYYKLGAYGRAEREFEFVLRYNPPPEVQAKIRNYLNAMRGESFNQSRTRSGAYLSVGAGWDSNVNAGTYNDTLLLADGLVQIEDPSSQENESAFTQIGLGWNGLKRVDKQLSIIAGLDTQGKHNVDANDFDTISLGGFIGFSLLKESGLYRLSISDSQLWVDSESYRSTFSLSGDSTHHFESGFNLTTALQHAELDHGTDNEASNSTVTTVGFGFDKHIDTAWPVLIKAKINYGDSKNGNFRSDLDKDILSGSLSASVRTTNRTSLNMSFTRQSTEYGADDLVFGTTRDDDLWSGWLGMTQQLSSGLSLQLNAEYTENSSNQMLYAFKRWSGSLALRQNF